VLFPIEVKPIPNLVLNRIRGVSEVGSAGISADQT
jgi:hypothetical protein